MSSIKDLKLNPPKKKSELTKHSMLKFIKENGTAEDKVWFFDLMNANVIKKKSNLTGDVIEGYDIPKVREEFAKKFFPEISNQAKNKKKTSTKTMSFKDELKALVE